MLELRPECETCAAELPHDAKNAMICSYECTFCSDCVTNKFNGKCPNCGGNLEQRPTRIAAAVNS